MRRVQTLTTCPWSDAGKSGELEHPALLGRHSEPGQTDRWLLYTANGLSVFVCAGHACGLRPSVTHTRPHVALHNRLDSGLCNNPPLCSNGCKPSAFYRLAPKKVVMLLANDLRRKVSYSMKIMVGLIFVATNYAWITFLESVWTVSQHFWHIRLSNFCNR